MTDNLDNRALLNDFFKLTKGVADMLTNPYETRKIARTEVNGLTVSTANTFDCGPETAILDANGVHIVEHYKTSEEAKQGHERWVVKAHDMTHVIDVGYGESIEPEVRKLERFS